MNQNSGKINLLYHFQNEINILIDNNIVNNT